MTREELVSKIEDLIRNEVDEGEAYGRCAEVDDYYEGIGPDPYGAARAIMKLFDQFTQGETASE